MKSHDPYSLIGCDPDCFEVDFETLKTSTLRELEGFVMSCLKRKQCDSITSSDESDGSLAYVSDSYSDDESQRPKSRGIPDLAMHNMNKNLQNSRQKSTNTIKPKNREINRKEDSITIKSSTIRGGKKLWDKYHFCPICHNPFSKMPSHLLNRHKNNADVAILAMLPLKSN